MGQTSLVLLLLDFLMELDSLLVAIPDAIEVLVHVELRLSEVVQP